MAKEEIEALSFEEKLSAFEQHVRADERDTAIELARKFQDAERDTILMLIAHLQDLLPKDRECLNQIR